MLLRRRLLLVKECVFVMLNELRNCCFKNFVVIKMLMSLKILVVWEVSVLKLVGVVSVRRKYFVVNL